MPPVLFTPVAWWNCNFILMLTNSHACLIILKLRSMLHIVSYNTPIVSSTATADWKLMKQLSNLFHIGLTSDSQVLTELYTEISLLTPSHNFTPATHNYNYNAPLSTLIPAYCEG